MQNELPKENDLESEKRTLNKKIDNLEKQLQSSITEGRYNNKKTTSQSKQKPANDSSGSKYRISAIIGATIPINSTFGLGPNLGLRLDTPFSFTLAGMTAKVGIEVDLASMSPTSNSSGGSLDFINAGYFLTNFVGNVSISPFDRMNNQHFSSLEIIFGLGITSASISQNQTTALSIPMALIYYLPIDLSGYKIGLNLHTQITLGHATMDNTTSLINVGVLIKTPIQF